MYNLIYRSKATSILNQNQIQDMLIKARSFNQSNEITGCLLFYHEEFLQYLEGEECVVKQLFEKIKVDDRHFNVSVLSEGNIYNREFKDWQMAYQDFLKPNHQLLYLEILVNSYFENGHSGIKPNPTTKSFWYATKQLLTSNSLERNN